MPNRMVAFDAVDQLRHDPVVQRRRIEIDRHAGDQRQHQPDRQPEGMEHRQHVEHLVLRPKSMRAAACAAFASMLRWDSTTPFGVPSEPEVNRIAAQSSGLRVDQRLLVARAGRAACRRVPTVGADVVEIDDLDLVRERVDQRRRAGPSRRRRARSGWCRPSAALQAARMLAAPAVKLIIAGTRPADISAEQRHRRAVGVRQHHADRLALGARAASASAEHARADQQPLVGERAGDRVLDRDAAPCRARRAASISASNTVRSVERGAEDEVRHDLVERRARRLPARACP